MTASRVVLVTGASSGIGEATVCAAASRGDHVVQVASRILAIADRGVLRSQVGVANDLMRLGFTTLPWVYDALVTPLFRAVAPDQTTLPTPGPGNVVEPPDGNAMRGGQRSALVGLGRNLAAKVRGPSS